MILFEDDDTLDLDPAPRLAHVLNLGVDWQKRVIHLDGEIEAETGSWFWTVVSQLGPEPIEIQLNTPGGDVCSMYAIHDGIRKHGGITTVAFGECCSAGVLILACSQTRLVTESLILMTHESTGSPGELGYRAAKDRRKAEDWQHEFWAELMARYTNEDQAWWKKKTRLQAEYWLLGGAEIVEAGIADRVI